MPKEPPKPIDEDDPPKNTRGGTDREYIIDLWYGFRDLRREVGDIRTESRMTNERLTKLEKFMWLSFGVWLSVTTLASAVAVAVSV